MVVVLLCSPPSHSALCIDARGDIQMLCYMWTCNGIQHAWYVVYRAVILKVYCISSLILGYANNDLALQCT